MTKQVLCTKYTLNYTITHKTNLFDDYPTSDTKCKAALQDLTLGLR